MSFPNYWTSITYPTLYAEWSCEMNANLCWKTVTYEQDNRTYIGHYIIKDNTITVMYEDSLHRCFGKSAPLLPGGLGELRSATAILSEVISEMELGVPA